MTQKILVLFVGNIKTKLTEIELCINGQKTAWPTRLLIYYGLSATDVEANIDKRSYFILRDIKDSLASFNGSKVVKIHIR